MQAQAEFNIAQHKKSLLNTPSWEMAGLKAAGINPLLRYGQHGSPNPSSAQGVSQAPSVNRLQGAADALGQAGHSAIDAYKKSAEVDQIEAQINKIGEEIINLGTTRGLTEAQTANTLQATASAVQGMALTAADILLRGAQRQQVEAAIRNADMENVLMRIRERLLLLEERTGGKLATLADLSIAFLMDAFSIGGSAADALSDLGDELRDTSIIDLFTDRVAGTGGGSGW